MPRATPLGDVGPPGAEHPLGQRAGHAQVRRRHQQLEPEEAGGLQAVQRVARAGLGADHQVRRHLDVG